MEALRVLILLMPLFPCAQCNIEFSQPVSMTVKPGGSLTISCKVSGYSVTDDVYATAWIRQPAGKELEWITHIWGGGTIRFKESLKSRFSISKDSSTSTVSLQGQSLQAEDTAVYYCVRYSESGAFHYWGKGTMITVTSGSQTKPAVFPLQSCASDSSKDLVDIGCLATGYVPSRSVTFTWRDKGKGSDISDFVQYPEVQSNGAFSVFTQIKVKAEDWLKSNAYTCNVNQGQTTESADVIRMVVKTVNPTLYVMTPSQEELNEKKSASFACLAKGFSPRTHKLKWFLGEKEVTENVTSLPEVKDNGGSLFSASSFLSLNEKQWKSEEARVTCVFERKPGSQVQESVAFRPPDCIEDPIVVKIIPPSPEKFFLEERILLGCKVTGDLDNLGDISWQYADGHKLVSGKGDEDGNSKVSWLSISYEEWSNGTEFMCIVPHSDLPLPKKVTYQRENGRSAQAPSVFILGPAEQAEQVTLTCYAKEFYPKEVLISWLVNDEPMDRSQFKTTSLIQTGDTYSVYSQLTIGKDDWAEGKSFSCAVHHETNSKQVKAIVRAIDSLTKKPSNINLSLSIPQTCKAA